MKKLLLLLVFLLIFSSVQAATIHGTVYDFNLDKLENVIVEINTVPKQSYVSKDATYHFDVNPGNYILAAAYLEDNYITYEIQEEIQIEDEGEYTLDLILMPSLDEEFYNGTEIELIDIYDENGFDYNLLLIILAIILIIGVFVRFKLLKHSTKKISIQEDNLPDKILEIIKKQGGRTTQKEIRKQIPLSEAKISLVITELEHKGLVEKIKKGRGNVIILKK